MFKQSALLVACLCASPLVTADQVVLKNGDALQGQIMSMTDGVLVFNSPILGELTIAMDKLESFSSTDPVKLQLVDGSIVEQVVSATKGVVELETDAAQQVSVEQLAGINPAPEKPVEWNGKVFAGLNIQRGNTKTQDADLDVKATRETKGDRIILDARYEEDRREADSGDLSTSKRYYSLGGHYDYFVSEKTYVYGDGQLEKESTANLEQRIKLGAGGGYRWVETARTRFEVEGGLSWVTEEFVNNSPDEEYAALRAATRLSHKLSSDISLFNEAEWLASLEDSDEQLFSMDTGLAYQINGQLSLEAKLHYDWDKSPPAGNSESDTRYVFGVSWGF